MQFRACASILVFLMSMQCAAGVTWSDVSMAKQAQAREAALHSEMKSMMEDDDSADASAASPRTKPAFLQAKTDVTDYLGDSASSLSAALGPRWNGQRLESDAKAKTDALLQAIAGRSRSPLV
mmetsp:Transcript_1348/g.3622  ORF Transcript_1348/g.3622 Transcript_1348/m.3622 type:complete len:123 (+) Transcript_1348:68-436(+)